ncbi:MAG TPA: hypothetical protein VFJ96_13275 [Gemmatimonadaceae bacterium]|nr:hypothetical protein [Gemmatimonadaceae bacterium]
MRCLIPIACTVALLVASAPYAMAQQSTTDNSLVWRVSVGTGFTAPLDLEDSRTLGLGARGSLTVGAPHSPLALRVDLFYEHFGLKDVTAGSNAIIGESANALWYVSTTREHPRPYLVAGVGAAQIRTTVQSGQISLQHGDYAFIFNAGAGLEIPVSSHALFVEARVRGFRTSAYTWWKPDGSGADHYTWWVPVVVGVTF